MLADLFFFSSDEEFQFIDPTAEEMDNGFVFAPVSFHSSSFHDWSQNHSFFSWNFSYRQNENGMNL